MLNGVQILTLLYVTFSFIDGSGSGEPAKPLGDGEAPKKTPAHRVSSAFKSLQRGTRAMGES